MAYCKKLTLNTTKTEFMLIGSRQKLSTLSSKPELWIDNVPIEKVTSVKSLGIFIDENLRWQTHIDKLSKKIAFGIGEIKRIRDFVQTPTLHCIYNALIQSQFCNSCKLCGVIVEKLCLTGYRSFRTVLLVF